MLKQFAMLTVAMCLIGSAIAQSPDEIARAQSGLPCAGCNLFQADLSFRDLTDANFAHSRLRQADLSLVTMNDATFRNSDLSVANLFGGRFTSADFSRANLERATLVGAYFGYANFDGATFNGANLSGADFTGAEGLTQAQLDPACGDASTRLPTGLRVTACR